MAKRKKGKRGKGRAIGKKIQELRHEGVPEKQAVGAAYGMEREGRLTSEGGYIRAHKKGTRRSPFAKYKRHGKRSRRRGGRRA